MSVFEEKICEIGHRAASRGLLVGTEGNLSCRIAADRVWCTPTMFSKALLTPEDLCLTDLSGQLVGGAQRPSSEMQMHYAIYRANPKAGAVVHAHPPFATTFAVLREPIPTNIMPEAGIFLGPVAVTEYQTTGTSALAESVGKLVAGRNALLIANHGAVTWAWDLETAYNLMETLEAVCRVIYQARTLGEPKAITPEQMAEINAIRDSLDI